MHKLSFDKGRFRRAKSLTENVFRREHLDAPIDAKISSPNTAAQDIIDAIGTRHLNCSRYSNGWISTHDSVAEPCVLGNRKAQRRINTLARGWNRLESIRISFRRNRITSYNVCYTKLLRHRVQQRNHALKSIRYCTCCNWDASFR